MINKAIKQQFYLYPSVYFAKAANDKLLLYNTKTGQYIECKSLICCQLIDEIHIPENLGVLELTAKYLCNKEVIDFIENIVEQDFGKIVEQYPDMPKPINLLPILNLQDDIDRLRKDEEHDIGEKSLRYLNELNIYLNGQCDLNCPHCSLYYKQIKSCSKENKNELIQPFEIKKILDILEYAPLKKVNFLGGNIFLYPYLEELIELTKSYDFDFHYWIHITNLFGTQLDFNQNREILIYFPIDIASVTKYIEEHKADMKINYHFLIENEVQYNDAELIIKTTGINNYQIRPIYTGANISFFEANTYLGKEDIFATIISQRILFCNQKLNSNYFGKLFILPDGTVKANMNAPILGNIHIDFLLKIIGKELSDNTAWRVTRNSKPCDACAYQYLCPPPSNYETVIGKPNLCHVNPFN
jgi:pseudo-rSAM protein